MTMPKDDPEVSIIIRNVPESVRRALKSKAAAEGKPMNKVILELITRYVGKEVITAYKNPPKTKEIG